MIFLLKIHCRYAQLKIIAVYMGGVDSFSLNIAAELSARLFDSMFNIFY